jgi:hypothetical protein
MVSVNVNIYTIIIIIIIIIIIKEQLWDTNPLKRPSAEKTKSILECEDVFKFIDASNRTFNASNRTSNTSTSNHSSSSSSKRTNNNNNNNNNNATGGGGGGGASSMKREDRLSSTQSQKSAVSYGFMAEDGLGDSITEMKPSPSSHSRGSLNLSQHSFHTVRISDGNLMERNSIMSSNSVSSSSAQNLRESLIVAATKSGGKGADDEV